ncbi:hypothetical protein NERG_00580 [Nematocida ausubeli]|uniref:Uncharacterized protein n=1 Tax=Nematocida ausubeli (strain ATCC PRA-371 / ERTm2) TaxID=1913371 RepID=H8ZAF9_NEMA1|nr:hypothetical protein NERG_00580 [Nematocida ausubeli]
MWKITTPSEISYTDRGFENKKIAIAKSSLLQDQNTPINTDAILQREKHGQKSGESNARHESDYQIWQVRKETKITARCAGHE